MRLALILAALWLASFSYRLVECIEPPEMFFVSGYNRWAFSPHTADGTPVNTGEPIVAAHERYPFNVAIWIEGLGVYRVADRGQLGWSHLDVAVDSDEEAYRTTGEYRACRVR